MMEDAATSMNHITGHGELHLKYLGLGWLVGCFDFFFLGALFINENY